MARLIDADLLLQWVEKLEAYNMGRQSCFRKPKGLTPEGVRHMIDTMPEVVAVPVVRCKDCKHCTVTSDGMVCECALPTKRMMDYYIYGSTILARVGADDFCFHGERRTDERKAD